MTDKEDLDAIVRRLKMDIASQLVEAQLYKVVPRSAAIDNEDLIPRILEKGKLNINGIDFAFQKADRTAGEIYTIPSTNSLADYLEQSDCRNSILIVMADCSKMSKDAAACFAAEIVENSPNRKYQEVSKEKNIFSFFVFTPDDYKNYVKSIGGAQIRPVEIY